MKHLFLFCSIFLVLTGCKNDTKQNETTIPEAPKTPAELIAKAHGIDKWNQVSELRFTFAVDRDTIKGPGRTWLWMPKKDSVILEMSDQTVKYSRRNLDSTVIAADRAFINDKFWLLIPFQLIWDTSASISEPSSEAAPISKAVMNKITITYPSKGGYTPGDAYDIYYDDGYVIQEWTFRRGNDPEPSLSTTFEDYQNINGLMIATSHKREDPTWNLKFRDLNVVLE